MLDIINWREQEMERELVSIIVPVYNVEKYLDDCVNSILNQTYDNIELILVDDGSTDSSLDICKKWQKQDQRVKVLSQENQGQGPARNYGVREAQGEWISFVDSDDWVEFNYVEMLLHAATSQNANMAKCNYTQIRIKSGGGKTSSFFSSIGYPRDDKYALVESACWICNLIIKKSVLIEFGIEQPACKGQDTAVGLTMCLCAKKIAFVENSLYYYRKERDGATTTGAESKRDEVASKVIPWVVGELQRCKLWNINDEIIQRYIAHIMTLPLFGGWLSLDKYNYQRLRDMYYNAYYKTLGRENITIASFGSWNITETTKKMPFIQDMDYAYNFSGMISLMNKCNSPVYYHHRNAYRRKMIDKDVFSKLWDCFDEKCPDYLLLDFVEERNDVIRMNSGYITKSIALSQAGVQLSDNDLVKFGTEEWWNLWCLSFTDFVGTIQKYLPLNKVVLVKHYLVERYGTVQYSHEYVEIDEIHKINSILSKCYNYAESLMLEAMVIDYSKDDRYITDEKYEYGVEPYYINSLINERVGESVLETFALI